MEAILDIQEFPLIIAVAFSGLAIALAGLSLWYLREYVSYSKKRASNLPPLPEVPGLPILGNLLQLKEKKPHMTFTKWAQTYGPIYSIKTGANTIIVLNSVEVAKEAMVTRFSSISTRKLSKALTILTSDKTMVAMSDYNEFHKTVKRHMLTNVLGPTAQRRHRLHRDILIEYTMDQLYAFLKSSPLGAVTLRKIIEPEIFGLALKQALGKDVKSIQVEELGTTLSREELFKVLITDPMEGSIDVDWRDFFPYMQWVPNKSFEEKIQQMKFRRQTAMQALIKEQMKRISSGEVPLSMLIEVLVHSS
ncbi:unnamed protein product [Ilex paraguariensis]|uniref:Ent-kaurene oxidase n=1 Tax=Ilex paraguariensis TaxID=185542 RepID=A0ABC8RZG0_9AQUA